MELQLDMIQTTALAVMVYYFGAWVKTKINVLERFCIPAPVVGGIIFALLNLVLRQTGTLQIAFDTTLQKPAMILFFTTVGLGASLQLVKKGGVQVAIFWGLATLVAIFQDVISIGVAKVLDINPLLALLSGSVSMIGGHGTGAAFGNLFAEQYGVDGALTAAMAAATFGLVIGGIIGGPIGKKLIEKYNLKPNPDQYTGTIGKKEYDFNYEELFRTLMIILVAMALGSILETFFTSVGITLPSYIGAMLIAAAMLNIGEITGSWTINSRCTDVLGTIGLNVFLSIALMSLRLWELADIAGPMFVILVAQALFMGIMAYFIVYRVMGKDFDSAVISAGICGFGMGATPNGVANMEAVTENYGPAPRAFFVLPVVGAFLIDLTNAMVITAFTNIFA